MSTDDPAAPAIPPLPPALAESVARLSADAWRERKQAVERLRDYVRDADVGSPALTGLIEVLLDGLTNPEAIDGRAACHEVLVATGPRCIPALSRRLAEVDDASKRLLVDLLGAVGDASHAPLLVALLHDPATGENVLASASAALGLLGGEGADAALRGLLRSDSDMLKVYALDALRTRMASVPVEELEPLLQSPLCRTGAGALLGLTADVAALPALVALLDDEMAGARAAAAQGLAWLEEGLGERGGLVAAAAEHFDDATRSRLRALATHDDVDVRGAAIRLCGLARDAESIPVVLTVMDEPSLQERAFEMVASMGAQAAPALAEAVSGVDPGAREHYFRLVSALPPGSVEAGLLGQIVAALDEPDEEAAQAAAECLDAVGDRTCLGGLYRALAAPGRLGETAADAMASIMRRDEAQADLELIVGPAWPQTGALAQNLCRVVGRLGAPRHAFHLVTLLGSPDVGVRVAAAAALGSLPGEHEGTSALAFALADEEPSVRAAACRSLGLLAAMSACQSLISATGDDSPMVRAAAVQALVSLDNPVTLARLRAIIAEDPVPTVVVQAIAGLGRSALDQDLTMLMSLCMSKDHEVVKAAARALVHFDLHRATAALLGLLTHERWDVRWAAAEVLEQRRDATALGPLLVLIDNEDDTSVRAVMQQAIEAVRAAGDPSGADA